MAIERPGPKRRRLALPRGSRYNVGRSDSSHRRETTSRMKQLIHEIHRRSLWQVLAIYLGSAWIAYEAVQGLTEGLGLPAWFPGFAVVLFIAGLPIVLATAFVQEGGPIAGRAEKRRGPPEVAVGPEPAVRPAEPEAAPPPSAALGARRYLTWRNVLVAAVVIFAVWGVVSAGWILMTVPGLAVRAEAADFFGERDRVVVAEFENQTEQPALALAIQTAIVTDLDQSEYVNVVDRSELNAVLERMQLPDTARIDVDVALEIARREGYPAVVAGTVAPLGDGFQLTARIIEATTGEVAVRLRQTAANDAEVIAALERLSRLTRRHLGESLTGLQRSRPLPSVTTASLEALELYAQGLAYLYRGDAASGIPLMEQAVALDTAFASAYRGLSVLYGNLGSTAAGQANADKAYRHAERLIDRERYLAGAMYHTYRRQLDSAVYYYELMLDRDPELYVAANNLGDAYEQMGRYEDALPLYQRATELHPTAANGYLNVVSAAASLGRHAVAESAVATMRERFPGSFTTLFARFMLAQSEGDFDGAAAIAQQMAGLSSPIYSTWGHWSLAAVSALRGRLEATLAHADSSVQLAAEAGSPLPIYLALQTVEHAALAAGAPERARPYLEPALAQAREDLSPTFKHIGLGIIAEGHALAGDLTEAREILARMDSLVEARDFRPAGIGERARALIALLEDRPEDSLERLRRSRALDFGVLLRGGRLLLGDTYAALGRLAEAAAQYDTLTISYRLNFMDTGSYGPLKPLAHERAAAIYLALGDTAAAIKHLAAFTELWQDADPELQPRVESARRTLTDLTGAAR